MQRAMKKSRAQPQARSNRGTRSGQMIPHPPPLGDFGIKRDVRVRFRANAAFTGSITFQNLLDIFNMAATAATAFDLFLSVKIKAIEVWCNALTNDTATVTVVFDGGVAGIVGDQKIHTDSSMGIEPAHIKARPARQTGAALFQLSSAANAFFITVPEGAIVDLELSFRQPLGGGTVATQNVPAAATAGVLYMRGLDGVAVAASKFTPVGAQAID
jgi:hypothetical protein